MGIENQGHAAIDVSEILPRLWQGGTPESEMIETSSIHSEAIQRFGFTAVVTLDARSQPAGWGVQSDIDSNVDQIASDLLGILDATRNLNVFRSEQAKTFSASAIHK